MGYCPGYFANAIDFGWGEIPYAYQDFMIQNRNVEVAKACSAKAYSAFAEADIAAQTFSNAQNKIGADWRIGATMSGNPPVARDDRYYIIKDGDNNYYKLRFTGATKNGERGHVSFEYALVKSGE